MILYEFIDIKICDYKYHSVMTEEKETRQTTDSNVQKEEVQSVGEEQQYNNNLRNVYEVVFFVRYQTERPLAEDIVKYFSKYGEVHHIKCPEGRNYAFVFMTSLNTTAERRRTRTTISQIIEDMTPENRFYITVASLRYPRMNGNLRGYRRRYQYKRYRFFRYWGRPIVNTFRESRVVSSRVRNEMENK
ncbi:MAG: hypothetical protein QXW79_00470 [Thermoplasmata archaeon]